MLLVRAPPTVKGLPRPAHQYASANMVDKIGKRRRNSKPEYQVSAIETNSSDIVELISQAHAKALIIKGTQRKEPEKLEVKDGDGNGTT